MAGPGSIRTPSHAPYRRPPTGTGWRGFPAAEDIDSGVVEGLRHPMGPLALTDLIGLDTTIAVSQSLYEEFKEPLYAPPPLLSRMVEAGLLGRKVGRGFYDYHR